MIDMNGSLKGWIMGGMLAFGWLVIAVFTAFPFQAETFAAEPKTTELEVSNSIMSPVCPGKLLTACPSAEGAQLREVVRRKVDAGETKEQIVQYFVEVYGPSVLPAPPPEGFFLTAWLLPFMGLVSGLGVFFVLVKAWSSAAVRKREEHLTPQEDASSAGGEGGDLEKRLQRELEEFDQ